MNKPISLTIEEAREKCVNDINELAKEYTLDSYFLFLVVEPIYKVIEFNKNNQIQQDKTKYKERKKNEKISKNT